MTKYRSHSLYPATLKVYVIPSIQKIAFECPSSVCLSVRLPVRPIDSASFSLSAGSIFKQFSSNLLWEECLGLQMGKFWQISTELRPLIDVRNLFSLSIFGVPLPIFFKLGMRVDIVKEYSGIADGLILTNKYRVIALDWRKKIVFTLYLWLFLIVFLNG